MDSRRSRIEHPPRVLLIGGVGIGNVGNDASMRTVADILAEEVEGCRFAVASPFADAQHQFDWPFYPLRQHFGSLRQIREPLSRLRVAASCEARRMPQIIDRIADVDLVVVTGTGIFDDFGEKPWGMPYALLQWTTLARILARPIVYLAVGAGPIHNHISRAEFIGAGALANELSFRDEESHRYMRMRGLLRKDATVSPDLVFAHRLPVMRPASPVSDDAVVGLGVMAYGGWDGGSDGPVYERYVEMMARVATKLVSQGKRLRMLVGQPVDYEAVDDLMARCAPHVRQATDIPRIETFGDLLTQVGRTDMVLATRYHNIVAALLCHRPVVSLSYAPKNSALLRLVGLTSDRNVEDADPAWVLAQLHDVSRGRITLTDEGCEQIHSWRNQVKDQVRRLVRYL